MTVRRVGNISQPPCVHPPCDTAGLSTGEYEHVCSECGQSFHFTMTPLDVWRNDRQAERARRESAGSPLTPEELAAWCIIPKELLKWRRP